MRTLTAFEQGWLAIGAGRDLTAAEADNLARAEPLLPAGCLEWRRSEVRFRQFCGVVRLQDLQIEVLPKVFPHQTPDQQRVALLDMLSVSGELEGLDGLQATLGNGSHQLLDVFIRHFLKLLEQQVQQGLLRDYEEIEDTLEQVRGRIDVVRQQRENLFRPQRLACCFSELVADIPVNRLLNSALLCVSGLAQDTVLRQQLLAMHRRFSGIGTLSAGDRAPQVKDLNRMQRRYAGVVALAHLFLNGRYPDIRSGQQQVFSLLFDMNRLFERYTASRLRVQIRRYGLRLAEQGPRQYLGEDKSGRGLLLMRPDICLLNRDGNVPVAILDTKWKLLTGRDGIQASLSPTDLYQISTYAGAYGCDRVMLLYPKQGNFLVSQELYLNLASPVRLSIHPVPLRISESFDVLQFWPPKAQTGVFH